MAAAERTVANKNKAVSFAAYAALVDLFPARQSIYAGHMVNDLNYDPTDASTDPTTPEGVGNLAAQVVLDYRHQDGANQLGDLNGGAPYSDYTGYTPTPKNTWDKVGDPDRWQPLCVPTPPPGATQCTGRIQTYLTPFWAKVRPFRAPPSRTSSARRGPTPTWDPTASPAASTSARSTR